MFTSLVLKIKALENGKLNSYSGKKLHAVFLNIISEISEEESKNQHNDYINKAFSVSGLFSNEDEINIINENFYFFRISILDKNLLEIFSKALFKMKIHNKNIKIDNINFELNEILFNSKESKWAGKFDYNEITKKENLKNKYTINFISPTLFKIGDNTISEFDKTYLFKSLIKKYNEYSEIKINENFIDNLHKIFILKNDTRLKKAYLSKFFIRGFIGKVVLITEEKDENFLKDFNLLINFSFYSGVGYKTTMGFGQVNVS